MTAFVESLSKMFGAISLCVFALAALYLALTIFKLQPDLGKLLRKFARIDRANDIRKIVRRALEDEPKAMINVTPRETKKKAAKVTPPELLGPIEP
jgi:hypothetical protein